MEKGRVLIPKSMREAAKLEYGGYCLSGNGGWKNYSPEGRDYRGGRSVSGGSGGICPYSISVYAGQPPTGSDRRTEQTAAEKGRGKIMQEFTEKGLYADRKGGIYPEPGGGSSLKGITRALHGQLFSVRISRKQKIPDIPLPIWFPLSTGRHGQLLEQGCGWRAAARTVGGKSERLQLSQIRPFGALDLHGHSPEYSGYSFLPDGRYASGVWLANPEEVWSYVMMQKDYQYRILICDRDDFAVLEMHRGRMIFPDVQSLEQFQQAQKDGGWR